MLVPSKCLLEKQFRRYDSLSLSLLRFSSRNSNNRVCTRCYIRGAMQFGSLEREKDCGCASLTTKADKRAHGFGNRCETMSIRAWHAGKGSGKWLTYFPRWIHPPWRRAKDWIGYSHKASHHSVSPRLSRAGGKEGVAPYFALNQFANRSFRSYSKVRDGDWLVFRFFSLFFSLPNSLG